MFAIITGGTKGIGYSVAKSMAEMGYNLLLTYGADTFTAQRSCSELSKTYGVEASALQADVSDRKAVDVIARHVENRDLTIDVIVLNAGLTLRDSFEEMKESDWERVFYANVQFPVFLLQRLLGRIKQGGSVIFTGSLMAILPHGMSLAYGVTKAAVHALVKNMVKFLSPHGVRINAVAPGFVDTDWQKTKPVEVRRAIESKIALGRFGEPDELSNIYRMLIENTYINGSIIVADGGYSYK